MIFNQRPEWAESESKHVYMVAKQYVKPKSWLTLTAPSINARRMSAGEEPRNCLEMAKREISAVVGIGKQCNKEASQTRCVG